MLWNISLRLGHSFGYIVAASETEKVFDSWFLSQKPLKNKVLAFLEANNISTINQFLISSKYPEKLLDEHLESPCAFFVTSGFEDWMKMNLPVQGNKFTISPTRSKSPLKDDLVFGFVERVNSDGEVETTLNVDDLEALVPKLGLHDIKNIAIGFLNSTVNNKNELLAEEYLKEQGFNVFLSHKCGNASDNQSETTRWWSSILSASIYSDVTELFSDLTEGLTENNINLSSPIKTLTTNLGFIDYDHSYGLGSFLSEKLLLQKTIQNNFKEDSIYIYLGLDEFLLFDEPMVSQEKWRYKTGFVNLMHPKYSKLSVQPLQVIHKNSLHCSGYSDKELNFEPGPMCLGRGQVPCFLDLLFVMGKMNDINLIAEKLIPKKKNVILENLTSMARGVKSKFNFSDSEIPDQLYSQMLLRLTTDLICSLTETSRNSHKTNIFCFGPLTNTLFKDLKANAPRYNWQTMDISEEQITESITRI